ncbi:B3 domain-containing protein At1g49475-like [Pyrus communis]|uniref:B3 domain-containing protein At1g49475-like n=1 Tax=Pyrus communis TaxID=23211 RepID=UPI0035C1B285
MKWLSNGTKVFNPSHNEESDLMGFDAVNRIPNKFFRKYGDDLSNPVFLKLPTGSEWKIELRIWEGNSTFRVRVFDKDFTEINYPLTMPEMEETDQDDDSNSSSWDGDDDSDCVEVLDNIMSRSRKIREKFSLSCPRPHKKHRTSSTGKTRHQKNTLITLGNDV